MEGHEVISTGIDMKSDKTLTVETKANTALTRAKELIVRTDQDRVGAGDLLKAIKGLAKEVKQDREEERLAARKLLDVITSGRNRHLRPLEQAEQIIKQKVLDYEANEERKRIEEEERINAKLKQEEEDRKIAEAIEVEELGGVEEAKTILDSPSYTPPVSIPKTTPKIEGQHITLHFKCKIPPPYDLMPLVKAIAEGKAPIQYLSFNQVAANQDIKRIKDEVVGKAPKVLTPDEIERVIRAATVPGVEVYTEKSLASRSW